MQNRIEYPPRQQIRPFASDDPTQPHLQDPHDGSPLEGTRHLKRPHFATDPEEIATLEKAIMNGFYGMKIDA